jgi:hypothetical protein
MKKKTNRKGAKRMTVVLRAGGSRVIEPKNKPPTEITERKDNAKIS